MTDTTTRPHVIKDAKGKRPQFYDAPGMDTAMSMIMVLASELSTLRDRLDSAERVAKASGMDLAAGIEALELDQAALEEREARRQNFLERLFYLARKEAQEASDAETTEGFNQMIDEIAEG
ncbi:hypothetical protein GTZ99_00375 [Novosphingobium sp. FSY-8]|uniref:Terminase small subunit n=1 Tax=Novosphingobium ovatum TaxID=1908523 RepID=A0ABW9X902_9SPHN|nr:hypothetical protein [Novosphingobium ovatum]NBC35009.1 hypothetical protein [Novosphingobium ovatum]